MTAVLLGMSMGAAAVAGWVAARLAWAAGRRARARRDRPAPPLPARAGLPPVPTSSARHRRSPGSPPPTTATGVIRRVDPSLLPDRKDDR